MNKEQTLIAFIIIGIIIVASLVIMPRLKIAMPNASPSPSVTTEAVATESSTPLPSEANPLAQVETNAISKVETNPFNKAKTNPFE